MTANPNRSGCLARRDPQIVALDVGVVEAQQLDRQPVEFDRPSDVRQVLPPVGRELRDEVRARPAFAGAGVASALAGSRRGS